MTIVGKILVFFNLVFSLIVGGLVLVVFITRTNWETAFDKLKAQYAAVTADRDQTAREKDSMEQVFNDRLKTVTQERDDFKKGRDDAKNALARKEQELATIKQKEREKSADSEAVIGSLGERKLQVKELEERVTQVRKEKLEVIEQYKAERAGRIQADVEKKTFQARNFELESQVKELAKELIRAKSGPSGTLVTRKKGEENPPLDNVEGRVMAVDTEDNLVKLSIGSDSGLEPGHTLKVFRLHPIPEQSRYLGVIEIITVRPHEAVGRPLKAMTVPMRPGDRVASRLLLGS